MPPTHSERITLLAPMPTHAPFHAARASRLPSPPPPQALFRPRTFFTPVKPLVLPATPAISAPSVDLATASTSNTSTSILPAVMPSIAPPIRTGIFDPSAQPAPPIKRAEIKRSAFSTTEVTPSPAAPTQQLKTGGFGDAGIANPRVSTRPASHPDTPVEILEKPRPAYTAEARQHSIEGEVLLEVMFQASGHTRVLRRIRGLGYGLDESAALAAEGIRFRPAMRDGGAVDSTAVVHIVFQLAY
jgi:TonB family protein